MPSALTTTFLAAAAIMLAVSEIVSCVFVGLAVLWQFGVSSVALAATPVVNTVPVDEFGPVEH